MSVRYVALAQHRYEDLHLDSIRIMRKSKMMSNLVKQAVNSIKKDMPDTNQAVIIGRRSEETYTKYDGRIIRHIYIRRLRFEESFDDTGRNGLVYWGTRVLNAMHINTKDWVIRNNLFIKEGKEFEAFRTADNERYLRSLSFIQDARIIVKRARFEEDSVDVYVFTKDLFSLTGGIDAGSVNRAKGNIAETNLFGMGQRLEFTTLYDNERTPLAGYQMAYKKSNIGGSFIDATLGYTTIGENHADGRNEENGYFVQFDKPLISPNTKVAGGMFLGHFYTSNYYNSRPDSQFYKYATNGFDSWIGYNLASEKLLHSTVRDRRFLAFRYAQNYFDQFPYQVGNRYDLFFNDMQLALGSLTFFRQDFYKTNYVYGFGVTEDIPYGYDVSLTGGWYRQKDLKRPYAGMQANRFVISGNGDFIRYFFRAGGFYDEQGITDAGVLAGASMFSHLLQTTPTTKMRQYISLSYTNLFHTLTREQLRIDNPFGLQDFSYSGLQGYQRLNLKAETILYLNYKLLGFRFAPFVNGSIVLLTPRGLSVSNADIYSGIGGGVRTRNENLVFGTIELKAIYFPRQVDGLTQFKINLSSNLRYRYKNNFITKPDLVFWNTDEYN